MNIRSALLTVPAFLMLTTPAHAVLLWVVGIDNTDWDFTAAAPGTGGGANATFVQENGVVNALPGNRANAELDGQSDNDYYFAGSYTRIVASNGAYGGVGNVAANEESVERAFAGGDTALRYHFNVPATYQATDRITVSFDALNLDTSGLDPRWGVEVYINGNLVRAEEIIRAPQFDVDYTSEPQRLSDVGILLGAGGDNIVTLKGISYNGAGGGNWLGIDYVKVDIDNSPALVNTFTTSDALIRPGEPGPTLTWTLLDPAAVVTINQGIGDVTALTIEGTGSIDVNPAASTVYTITATLNGVTDVKTLAVNKTDWSVVFEAGLDNASNTEFSHDLAADDDYYFAGDYTSVGGPNQLEAELLNDDTNTNTTAGRTGSPLIGLERTVTDQDPQINLWFIALPAITTPESRLRITADVLTASGTTVLEFSLNGKVLPAQPAISRAGLAQFEVTGLSSNIVNGPNKLSIRRTGTTFGGNVVFDYLMLETLPGSLPTITGITDDTILGTHTVNWTSAPGKTYLVQKSTDSGATWLPMVLGFPVGGAPSTTLFYEDRVTPRTDPRPTYRVLLE